MVTSHKGPEAGVWVIAETAQLPTPMRKVVVTDDHGRYLLPELPAFCGTQPAVSVQTGPTSANPNASHRLQQRVIMRPIASQHPARD